MHAITIVATVLLLSTSAVGAAGLRIGGGHDFTPSDPASETLDGLATAITRFDNVWLMEGAGTNFGTSVATDSTLHVVGAMRDTYTSPNWTDGCGYTCQGMGAIYVYEADGSGAFTETKLVASDRGVHEYFGYSVAADAGRIAVGTTFRDAVYLYERRGGSWVETIVENPFPGPEDETMGFGSALALDGDRLLVGSGATYVLIDGETGEEEWIYRSGADLYDLSGAAPVLLQHFSGEGKEHGFGEAVALDGSNVLIGAWGGFDSCDGAAYLYRPISSGWSETRFVKPTPTTIPCDNRFGSAVAVSGGTVAIGAWAENVYGGAVHLFHETGSGWSTTTITPPLPFPADSFALTLALDDGRLAIGTRAAYTPHVGKVYLFQLEDGAPVATEMVTEPASAGQTFGYHVDLEAGHLLVGSPRDTTRFVKGHAFLYEV